MYGTEWIAPAVGAATQVGGQIASGMMSQNYASAANHSAQRFAQFMAKHHFQYMKKDLERAGMNPLLMMTGGAVHGAGAQPVPGPMPHYPDFGGVADDFADIARDATMIPSEKLGKDKRNAILDWTLLKERHMASAAESSNTQIKTNTALALADIEKRTEETTNLAHARALMDAQAGSSNARAALDRAERELKLKSFPRADVINSLWRDVGTVSEGVRSGASDVKDQMIRAKELMTGERYDLKTPEGRERWRREHGGD